jgi:hypothetical protein
METKCVSCEVRTGFFISQKTAFSIVTAVKASNLAINSFLSSFEYIVFQFEFQDYFIAHHFEGERCKPNTEQSIRLVIIYDMTDV